ncbi:MAG: hypothetical protein P4L58_01635, partial [Candidatus Pacebacteria bacterium]|nr:hypothetical protein [Candidatus Paceibacterota bacterium]
EDEIAHELGDQSHDAVNGPCAKSLETWITYFPKYFQVVRRDLQMDVGFFYDNCDEGANRDRSHPSDVKSYLATLSKELNMVLDGFGNQSNPTRQAILAKRIAILENTTLMFRKSSRPENLCALLLEPKVGPHYAGMLGGGPRPRVGGW